MLLDLTVPIHESIDQMDVTQQDLSTLYSNRGIYSFRSTKQVLLHGNDYIHNLKLLRSTSNPVVF